MKKKSSGKFLIIFVEVLLVLTFISFAAHAAVPQKINYQGYLTDAGGNPVNGTRSMVFSIYNVSSGGTALWTETQSVAINNGIYSVILGSVIQIILPFNEQYYLGVKVGTDAEMTPRQPLTSVAYAFAANTALSLPNNVITSAMIQDGAVSSADVNFNYAGSTSKGGPATDLACTGCVSSTELNFTAGDITAVNTPANSGLSGGATSGDVNLSVAANGITSAMIQDGTIMNTDINASAAIAGSKLASDGSVMKSLVPGTNITVNNNNNGSWTVNATGVGNSWSLTGNAGTTPGINFIGTTDDNAFEIKVNNSRALRIVPNITSPNLIGGHSGNFIAAGIIGATISGGGNHNELNAVTDNYGTVGGGAQNNAGNSTGSTDDAGFATVGGGYLNTASGIGATVGGGASNTASGEAATVGGGNINTASGGAATVGGGFNNLANALYATISGGGPSDPMNPDSTRNRVTDNYGTIGGGGNNHAGDNAGTISDATYATVGGGFDNDASGPAATVGGGGENIAGGSGATVGGGRENIASGQYATVSGGGGNHASGQNATVGGGIGNKAENMDGIVGGGFQNSASGSRSTVGGGFQNQATNNAATVPGGANNIASGAYSFAAGAAASATHPGSFVWSSAEGTSSFGDNTFVVRAHGGVAFYTASGTGMGCFIAPGGSDCAGASDRNIKENFTNIDSNQILETLSTLPIQTWNYKSQSPSIRHIGPVAQDFNSMFAHLFNESESPVHINKMDEIGISMAAIQGLYHFLKEKDARIKEQDARIEKLEKVIAEMERRLAFIEAPVKPLAKR